MIDFNRYSKLSKLNINNLRFDDVVAYFPIPSGLDYNRGWITRYFTQKINDINSPIYEISQDVAMTLTSNPYLNIVSVKWRLTGPPNLIYNMDGSVADIGVSESNRLSISLTKDSMPGLTKYLSNTLQFYKYKF